MRLVGGKWRGRKLTDLSGKAAFSDLRPTMDRVRETIFNVLTHGVGFEVKGARILDLFCGTGALGFEALSRGAKFSCFVDSEKTSLDIVEKNKFLLKADDKVNILRMDATKLKKNLNPTYNLIFLDPPYRKGLGELAIRAALEKDWISRGAMIVWEESDIVSPPKELNLVKSKSIGNIHLKFFERCD